MKIIVLDGFTLNPGDLTWDELAKFGELEVYDRTPEAKIIERIGSAEIVYTNKTPLRRETLAQLPSVTFIGVLATGYNIVDIEAAKEFGKIVTNIPTYGTTAVAQYVFALLLEICHHVGAHNDAVKNGAWRSSPDFCFWNYPLIELAGKTIGLIGFGKIGQATGRIASSFSMNILAYDLYKDKTLENEGFHYADLEQLLADSDVISLHCPLLESTKGIINKKTIAQMKDGVILINTARGPLVVEQDLADALNSGKIFSAAVDVVSNEPISPDNPLLAAKNCIITPHIAWAPRESRMRLMRIAGENLQSFLAGQAIHIVNR
jgi:glycerate dehydrogenase